MSNQKDYNGWENIFIPEFAKPYFVQLKKFLLEEYKTKTIYPPAKQILSAFEYTAYDDVNVVILGQDPYINQGQAVGLSFSVADGVLPPMSLRNIFLEIESDLGYKSEIVGGNLIPWAKQGVLLLNSILTVQSGLSGSHKGRGWEQFTDNVIQKLNQRERGLVFMLWGNYAISKANLVTNKQHLVLRAPHPSPLSAYNGFFGCGHFSKANEFLTQQYRQIRW